MNARPAAAASLPELREADAPPEVASLYAALRRASGVPLVNLIWRHMATLPGVLPWAWAAARAPLEDGRLATARERLAASLTLPAGLAEVDAAGWRAAGLAPADHAPILAVVEAYNRGNLTNLILLTALLDGIEGRHAPPHPEAVRAPAAAPTPLSGTLPALPVLAALPEAVRERVEALAACHGPAEARGGVVPSLYLHLAHWPALLAALPGWLAPLLGASGAIGAARDSATEAAFREARALGLPAIPPVPGGQGAAVATVLRRFTRQVIPEMVPIGLALRRILEGARPR